MALRPIDNALPAIPERPKKQAKVSIPIQTQKKPSDFGVVNDENKDLLPPSAEASIDYISSENLKPFQDPESKIQSLVEGLESKDWVKVCESLNDARCFSLYHSTLLLPILEKVILVVVKAMSNPRSALCKTSIMAASDIFNAFGEKLLEFTDSGAFDRLLLQLLLKASQDKKFVCEEADRSLKAMANSIAPLPLLKKLGGYVNHRNLRVRGKAAVSVSNSVSKKGVEEMKEFGLVTLLQLAAYLLNDRLPEAREQGIYWKWRRGSRGGLAKLLPDKFVTHSGSVHDQSSLFLVGLLAAAPRVDVDAVFTFINTFSVISS